MSKQDDTELAPLPHLATDDHKMWQTHWEARGQIWRTEPEIDTTRQKYLTERQKIIPDIAQEIYPFKDIKLNRADVEWLLATFDGGVALSRPLKRLSGIPEGLICVEPICVV